MLINPGPLCGYQHANCPLFEIATSLPGPPALTRVLWCDVARSFDPQTRAGGFQFIIFQEKNFRLAAIPKPQSARLLSFFTFS